MNTGAFVWIIPALAGNTLTKLVNDSSLKDHPRSRGEYCVPENSGRASEGSSPLSRGIRLTRGFAYHRRRIIPALAGNTLWKLPFLMEWRDHPRSRGEYPVYIGLRTQLNGSSPLSRGIRAINNMKETYVRIIPALAGNTSQRRSPTNPSRDHPRSRGEYWDGKRQGTLCFGSSPLSRGILGIHSPRALRVWIIPALAGNTITERIY